MNVHTLTPTPAELVRPGSWVLMGDQTVNVLRVLPVPNTWDVELITRSAGGAEIATLTHRGARVVVVEN